MKKKPEEWESRLGTNSFNPLEIFDLQDAVKDRRESVVLNGQRTFLLKYYFRGEEMVYYRPERGFAPCGHLSINRFLKGL